MRKLAMFYKVNSLYTSLQPKTPLSYYLNKRLCRFIMILMRCTKNNDRIEMNTLCIPQIKKILLVRSTFRMGNAILSTPAVFIFRNNFPHARIDFAGPPIGMALFKNLPIDNYFSITRRFPNALWTNIAILRKIRSVKYDLAVDVSCSQSTLSSFFVGFSGTHLRVGAKGRWDHWFNIPLQKPAERNKYKELPIFFGTLGIKTQGTVPRLILSPEEKEEGKRRIENLTGKDRHPVIGIFVGGRKRKGKRWPRENFLQLITDIHKRQAKVIVFFGPEEKKEITLFKQQLERDIPLIFEPSVRIFASLVSNCTHFITGDSGPAHLACALGIHPIILFQKPDFNHWGPPQNMARIIYEPKGASAEHVLDVFFTEFSGRIKSVKNL